MITSSMYSGWYLVHFNEWRVTSDVKNDGLKKTIENDRKKETEYASIWQFCLFGIESRFNRGYREKMRDYKFPSNPPVREAEEENIGKKRKESAPGAELIMIHYMITLACQCKGWLRRQICQKKMRCFTLLLHQ